MNAALEFIATLFLVLKIISSCFLSRILSMLAPSPPRPSLEKKVALVTGAGSGLGRYLCVELAKEGAIIVAWDIDQSGNQETTRRIRDRAGVIYPYTCDVSNRKQVFETAEKVRKEVGSVHVLVNNAAFMTGKTFIDLSDDEIENIIGVNLLAHFWTVKCFLPEMVHCKSGYILTVAGVASILGCYKLTDYCATKFGCMGFTESLGYELDALEDVSVTTVCPYFINTGMFRGCQQKFPTLLSALESKATAKRIVTAMLYKERLLVIPSYMYVVNTLRTILPAEAIAKIHNLSGASAFLDKYAGKSKSRRFSRTNARPRFLFR